MKKEKNNENYEVLDEPNGDSSSDEFGLFDVILYVVGFIIVGGISLIPVFVEYVMGLFEDLGDALSESNWDIWDGDRFFGYFASIFLTICTCFLSFGLGSAFTGGPNILGIILGIYSVDEAIVFFSNHPSIFKFCMAFAFLPTIGIVADIALTVFEFLCCRLERYPDLIDDIETWIDNIKTCIDDIETKEDLVKDKSKEEELKQERKKEEIQDKNEVLKQDVISCKKRVQDVLFELDSDIKKEVVEDKNEVLKQDVISCEKRVQDVLFELDSDIGFENNSDHVHTYVNNRFTELYNRICSLSDSDHKNFCLVSLKNAVLRYKEEEKKGTSNINDLNATLNYIMSYSNDYSENSEQHKLIK